MALSIAMIVHQFPKLSETFVLNQVAGLLDRGHRVDVYPLEGILESEPHHPIIARYGMMGLVRKAPRVGEGRVRGAMQRAIGIAGGVKRYDVVHAQFGTAGLKAMRLIKRRALAGRLLTFFRGNDISCFLRMRGQRIYDELFTRGDVFLTNCDYFRRRLVELGCPPERLAVNPSGIECGRFTYRERSLAPGETLRIVGTGRLVGKKGFAFAIDALAEAIRRGLDARLEILGEGALRGELEAQIKRLGLGDRVTLPGHCDQQTLIDRLDAAHLFLAPSVTAPDGDQDGPTNTLKEAMCMGLPVLATRHGGIPELVGDGLNGYLVDEHDTAALADRLLRMASETHRWPTFSRWGHEKVVRCFDMEATNAHLAEIYDALVRDEWGRFRSMLATDGAHDPPTPGASATNTTTPVPGH